MVKNQSDYDQISSAFCQKRGVENENDENTLQDQKEIKSAEHEGGGEILSDTMLYGHDNNGKALR